MKTKFYLNYQFFDFFLNCYYPLFDDVYLHILSRKDISHGYKKKFLYSLEFCVHPKSLKDLRIESFIRVFTADVVVSSRKLQLHKVSYVLESQLIVGSLYYFPLSPAWLIPSTNYLQFLNKCCLSLRVYRKEDWI